MVLIEDELGLNRFRTEHLTANNGLRLVRTHGGVLVLLAIGVGKSRFMDAITIEAVKSGEYDLVVVLCPTWALIGERSPVLAPPDGIKVVQVRSRPRALCDKLDGKWKDYERQKLSHLGRAELCGRCPRRDECSWPRQYGAGLTGAQIIYAAQEHLRVSPMFVAKLKLWTGARKILTLMDESNFIGASQEKTIEADELRRFSDVLQQIPGAAANNRDWLAMASQLANPDDDLHGRWEAPFCDADWASRVQCLGVHMFGRQFKFMAYDLAAFSLSDSSSRFRDEHGGVHFSVRPYFGDHFMIFSGSTDQRFVENRYGVQLANPFGDVRVQHAGTTWYNLATYDGSGRCFFKNSRRILDFFAELIARRTNEGRRVLLICKERFKLYCEEYLNGRLSELGYESIRVTADVSDEVIDAPSKVPLIHYGTIGINTFENFDAAYCLTGYYVNDEIIDECLQDVVRRDQRVEVEIETDMDKRRRTAKAERDGKVQSMAPLALAFKESEPVVQAVGRVRPFTKAREIITFQVGQLPGVTYTQEFTSLKAMRAFFGILDRRTRTTSDQALLADQLHGLGWSNPEIAAKLGVTTRTVRRYLQHRGGHEICTSTY